MYTKHVKRSTPNMSNDHALANSLSKRAADRSHGSPSQARKLPAVQARFNNPSYQAPGAQANKDVAQRVKIRLGKEETIINELHKFPVPGQGNQSLAHPDEIGDLNEIGANENIIFEAHGVHLELFNYRTKVRKHGDYTPPEIAAFAQRVPKPENWSGAIILMGCSTGDIVEEVSKEYYNLTGCPVTVTGPEKVIKVGRDVDGEMIVGPDDKVPEDPAYWKALSDHVKDFSHQWGRLTQALTNLCLSLIGENQENNMLSVLTEVDAFMDIDRKCGKDVEKFTVYERKLYCVDERTDLYLELQDYSIQVARLWKTFNDQMTDDDKNLFAGQAQAILTRKQQAYPQVHARLAALAQRMLGITITPITPFDTGFITRRMRKTKQSFIDYFSTWKDEHAERTMII